MARCVGDLEDHPQARQLGQHLGQRRREPAVHDDGRGAGVVEQVAQLLGDVAVVDVERRDPGLERSRASLEVLVAVVEVDGQVVLAATRVRRARRARCGTPSPWPTSSSPAGRVRSVTSRPGQPAVPEHQALGVGRDAGDGFEHVAMSSSDPVDP